jgi:hypothetical protein
MKLKLLLLFLMVVGFGALVNAQSTKAYNNLIITEIEYHTTDMFYLEITNMGIETINLKEFQFQNNPAWAQPYTGYDATYAFMLPDKLMHPGESFVVSSAYDYNPKMWPKDPQHYREVITKPEFYKLADLLIDQPESTPLAADDKASPVANSMACWDGRECFAIRHFFTNPDTGLRDSAVVDQVGGVFDNTSGTNNYGSYDVAGVVGGTSSQILIRKNSIKTGNLNFKDGRGLDVTDSEWIPIPILSLNNWNMYPLRAVFWTVGNQVDAKINDATLVPKNPKVVVDLTANTITVPWGVRNMDSIMYQFQRKPGLAWGYDLAGTSEDSAYISARTGDILTLYACGDQLITQKFTIKVLPPTADDNIVIPKNAFDFNNKNGKFSVNGAGLWNYSDIRVTDGVKAMDTISRVDYSTRVDTLFKYLEKAPKASWQIVYKSGVAKPDLQTGDLLKVTSESGKVKNYFLKLEKYVPSFNALLSSITWPDIPADFKGEIAGSYGWKGDTIPGFASANYSYLVKIPVAAGYDGIPALTYTKQDLDSKVVVKRAKTLDGTVEDRTVTFTVTAENDTIVSVYKVQFEKEKDPANLQPYIAEPFISQIVFRSEWTSSFMEIYNPGTEPIDLSHYMFAAGWGPEIDMFNGNNATANWNNAYLKYIPGKKWQDEANWQVQPRIAEPDLNTSSLVYPGETFVFAYVPNGWLQAKNHPYIKYVDINFAFNPYGRAISEGQSVPGPWFNNNRFMYKILNDSVINGLKPATDRNDFELMESIGGANNNGWKVGGVSMDQRRSLTRKPNITKGNPVPDGSFGTTLDNSEWIMNRPEDYSKLPWPDWYGADVAICTGIGSHAQNEVTSYKSTVTSLKYRVSPGYSAKETIKGLTTGTTVTGFYQNLLKADALQDLKVKSSTTGLVLADGAAVLNGDVLVVLSADSTNTSEYILSVTAEGLSSNAKLTSSKYTINVTGTTGTVGGFSGVNPSTPLRDIVAGIVVPNGATLTLTDENDAYMTLNKLTYDSTYTDVIATDKIYLEVIAENGINKITYQLIPTADLSQAYVTSDVYSVDQDAALIQFIPEASSVYTLMSNLTPAPGATMKIYDKAGFLRTAGNIYKDDKLLVTSKNGTSSKGYLFSILNFKENTYLAYVTSSTYKVDQVALTIKLPTTSVSISDFYKRENLLPSYGASLMVIDKDGNPSGNSVVTIGDRLQVVAADNSTTVTYLIGTTVGVSNLDTNEMIKMYPNPTTDKVVINGLAKGNRVRVYNATGITLRDVTVNNSTEYVSLAAQPAGIYVFVISSGEKFINIQKIIKK